MIPTAWPVSRLALLTGHSGKRCGFFLLVLIYRPASSVPSRVCPRPVSRSNSEAGLTGRAQGRGAGAGECCSERRRVGRLIIVQHVSNKGQRQREKIRTLPVFPAAMWTQSFASANQPQAPTPDFCCKHSNKLQCELEQFSANPSQWKEIQSGVCWC